MTLVDVRPATPADFPRIVELNAVEVQHTSAMDLDGLRALAQLSSYFTVVEADDCVAGFLLAMRETAAYLNDNYAWFATRFEKFIYVDRIVIDAEFAGLRLGSALYDDLFAYGRSQGITTVTCEYNIDPPNPASKRFHDRYGFREHGTQWVANGTKLVSLQAAEI